MKKWSPYIKAVAEHIQRTMKKCRFNTTVRPHTTLKHLLVHPKDKIPLEHKRNVIYEIHCQSREKSFAGKKGEKLLIHGEMNTVKNVKKKLWTTVNWKATI